MDRPSQKKDTVAEAICRKYPEQVVLVTTRSRSGHANVMAVGWVCVASSDPLMFLLGIDEEAYTYELIRKTRQFVVAFPSEKQASETLFVGTRHGRGMDKFASCGLRTQKASVVKAPLVAGAVANFECRLVEITRPGDCPLIVGRVVAAHMSRNKALGRLYSLGPAGDKRELGGVRPHRA
jgi:flavin reductase (DIM6/NTAB) family NADH-FMN oxidoreductase RutF